MTTEINGIVVYAPELNDTSPDYPPDSYEILAVLESKSFWFIWRNRIIQYFFGQYIGSNKIKFLEIGCGNGFVLKGLQQRYPLYDLYGADIHVKGMLYARSRLPHAKFVQLDAINIPFSDEYDAIGMFDSLEHIADDVAVIRGVNKALKLGGKYIITVPQHPFLWSYDDDYGGHKRRYTLAELKMKLLRNGFRILHHTSFVSTLFPVLYMVRVLGRKKDISREQVWEKSTKQLMPGKVFNFLASCAMILDYGLIQLGIRVPFGGSLLIVAEKYQNQVNNIKE